VRLNLLSDIESVEKVQRRFSKKY